MQSCTVSTRSAHHVWMTQHYDRVNLILPYGGKEPLKKIAVQNGVSLNTLILRAISETYGVPLEIGGNHK